MNPDLEAAPSFTLSSGKLGDFEYLSAGSRTGAPVLFLHGLFGDPANWAATLEALAPTHRVLALRFPFFDGRRLERVEQLAAYVLDFLDALEIERASLGGNSLGGQVAIELGLGHPERVEALILTGSAGLWESRRGGPLPQASREFIRQRAREVFYDPRHVTEEMVEEIYRSVQDRGFARALLRIAKATQAHSVAGRLHQLRAPTLIVWGQDDQITPPAVAHQFHREIPRSELVLLPRCGHAPPIERPRRFAQVVCRFLTEQAQTPVASEAEDASS